MTKEKAKKEAEQASCILQTSIATMQATYQVGDVFYGSPDDVQRLIDRGMAVENKG